MSHSHVVEWIFGSRIQSHWPCRMLCPISMFSRILATERPAVPTTQAGGKSENSSTAREPSSRLRWVLMTLRMYRASFSPRVSIAACRMASSSMPSISMSSGVRCAIWLSGFLVIIVMAGSPPSPSVVEAALAGRRVDAGLDLDAAALVGHGRGDGAGAQVTHAALLERQHAAEADAHPAAARHQDAGRLGRVEDRGV